MHLNQDFVELLSCLAARDARYLVVGGYALAIHGHPRYTKDLDVWVWADPDNANAVLLALEDFGFGGLGLTADDFTAPDSIVQLGYPPQRVDLITSPDGVTFDECWPNRLEVVVDGVAVPFIGRDDLITNKEAAGRGQDLVDADLLRRSRDRPDTRE